MNLEMRKMNEFYGYDTFNVIYSQNSRQVAHISCMNNISNELTRTSNLLARKTCLWMNHECIS